jgi:hypothetical protein
MGIRGYYPMIKLLVNEANHSLSPSAEDENLWSFISILTWCLDTRKHQCIVDLYIHSPTRLHGVVLNELSTGTILPFTSLTLSRK